MQIQESDFTIEGLMDQQELHCLLQDLRQGKLAPEERYHVVATCGKQQFLEALPDVERLLIHEDENLRNIALLVLGFDWRKQEYWQSALEMLQHDPDDNNRFVQ